MSKRGYIVLSIWCFSIILLLILSLTIGKGEKVEAQNKELYEEMIEASNLAKQAMDAIKEYKINNGIALSEEDILETGMIGTGSKTTITTTEGVLEAKRTTCNPEWAAVLVKVIKKAGLKEGDEVGMIFSGSFPALNICAMAASQVCGLKSCIMASIGASYYGANQTECTFFDMSNYLFDLGIFNKKVDYYSLGGADDIGYTFKEPFRTEIIDRINNSSSEFIYYEDYKENIDNRLKILSEDVPNMKLMINCGGSIVAYGEGLNVFFFFLFFNGYKNRITLNEVIDNRGKNYGLLQCERLMGVDIFSMRDIKTLSKNYGIPYDPSMMPEIGSSDVFYENNYSLVYPIIGLFLSIVAGAILFMDRKKYWIFK